MSFLFNFLAISCHSKAIGKSFFFLIMMMIMMIFSQIWSKSPKSKSAGGQWANILDTPINCYI